jgi:large subunit ribosomal protein L10
MVKAEREARPEKQKEVEALKAKFGAAKGIVLADYTGVTVAEVSELRRKCREAEVEYKVIKNTLARIAAREMDLGDLAGHFDGPIAVALSSVDSIAPARVLAGFMKEYQKMTVRAGYFDGRIYSESEVTEIANLPSREQLLGQVVGMVQGPMTQLVYCIETVLRNVVSVVEEAGKKAAGPA